MKLKEEGFINTINGNIVHVTVNNFITTEKKTETTPNRTFNSRPYSSDFKERDKRVLEMKPGKFNPYENTKSVPYQNPY
jgi:hypothetical protein